MANFVWIGKNSANVKGLSSKAYCIRRVGKTVTVKYGSIQVLHGGGGKYYWLGRYPKIRAKKFRTEAKAKAFNHARQQAQSRRRYEKLPGRMKIYPSRTVKTSPVNSR